MSVTLNLKQFGKWGVCVAVALGISAGLARAQATQPQMGEYHPTVFPESYHGAFYPAAELRALPGARAAAVAAQAEMQRAQTEFNIAVSDLRLTFTRSKE